MKRLRVAYMVGTLKPGGAERQMLTLAERLPRERFSVEFIQSSGPGSYEARAAAAGVRVNTLGPPPSGSGPWERIARRGTKTAHLVRVVGHRRFDIVDAWLYPNYVLAALIRPLTRTPVVIAGRRNLGDLGDRSVAIARVAELAARPLTDAVVANSDAVAADALRAGVDPRRLRVIRNGVELIEPTPPERRAAIRDGWGLSADDVVIGCVANYREVKGHDTLLDAFSVLAGADPRLRLVLVGDGLRREHLAQRIAVAGLGERVRLHGSELDPRPLYGAFDIVVQSSRSEGLPNAMLEAAAAAVPIVATSVGGTPEIVVDGESGRLVAPGDPDALARALRDLAVDQSLRARFGAAGRAHVARVFGMDRFVNEFAEMYDELALQRGVGR